MANKKIQKKKLEVKQKEKKKALVAKKKFEKKSSVNKKELKKLKPKKKIKTLPRKMKLFYLFLFDIILTIGVFLAYKNIFYSLITLLGFIILVNIFGRAKKILTKSARIKRMEEVFPDFLQLVSSNLRAGMTIDRALILSARKEFAPLDEEILAVGKEILTGKELTVALLNMAKRIKSEKINRTILLIVRGIRAGGNLSILLEEIATNTRERNFVEKKASSSVVMYVIFIFFAISIGAPVLFALSSILVEVMTSLLAGMPETSVANINLPFALTQVDLSITFVIWYSIIFLIVLDILASLILGLVGKGSEKQGLKYIIPLILMSLGTFFLLRHILSGAMGNFIP